MPVNVLKSRFVWYGSAFAVLLFSALVAFAAPDRVPQKSSGFFGGPDRACAHSGIPCDREPITTPQAQTAATFYQDIQPILDAHCIGCHAPGEIGAGKVLMDGNPPGAELARGMADAVQLGSMPPWMPGPETPPLRDERRLTWCWTWRSPIRLMSSSKMTTAVLSSTPGSHARLT